MAREREVVIESFQLTKVFRDFWRRVKVRALDRVDLQVYQGEVFGLLGPNGSGKSTFIKVLLGLLFPTAGNVAVFGRSPRNIGAKERIGYQPEESYLYKYLNAVETLDFYGRLFRLNGVERRRRTDALLEMVGLAAQRTRPMSEYSKGMARRMGLAQALINDPDLLVLDEPTTGLDPIGTREIKDLILELKRRGKTVLLCSHLLADVEDVCDRIAILYGGRVRRMGGVKQLLKRQAVTQINADELAPETVAQILDLIEQRETGKKVTVETPMDRLEDYFLHVVEEAQEAQLATGGATVGGGFERFFEREPKEKTTEEVLAGLVSGAETPADEAPVAEAETEHVVLSAGGRTGPDTGLLDQLTEEETPAPPKPEAVVLPAREESPGDEVSAAEVLGRLVQKSDTSKKDADGKKKGQDA